MNQTLYYAFRLLRKIKTGSFRFIFLLKLYYYKKVSLGRFIVHYSAQGGKGFQINSDLSKTKILVEKKLKIRDNFKIRIGSEGKLSIGHKNFFNNNCSINCLGNIEIGNNNQFGERVLLYDHNHNYKDDKNLISNQGYSIGSIKIGSNCWIGSGVIILKDVSIGDNVVIGAGCIIYKSIESNVLIINKQSIEIKPLFSQ